ncbi:glyoxalase/bleomycin resistance protein/dioxygenase [Sphingomonas sp. MM-1]|uniref:VOC family protein n=1 Tax=Sphingomonas sp. MM-1 TaxID=745310 RepID=UPI0002C0B9C4|nr:VOC family protein [Sphingomonas sp. MM-1]AGH49845.1 glyoxalase/bleomycin resistance protein/dioxygenase [Sphingomonas sp. MM-1]
MLQQTIIPCLRYADAPTAIDFLCRAFGFDRHAIHADDADPRIVHHAQLRLGANLVMLGSARADEAQARYRWKTPAEAAGVTACIYCVIDDADAHYVRARAEGADIATQPHDNEGYPGRSYSARDPEGNIWDFGTYDPWA